MMALGKKTITIVGPLYNEEGAIGKFCDRAISVLEKVQYDYEIIFIDDGSTDKTLNIISHLAERNKKVKVLSFSRNFGHMIALSAGLDYAGVAVSSNYGTTWKAVDNGLPGDNVTTCVLGGQNLFVGTYGGGVFRSTNFGTEWTSANAGLSDLYVRSLVIAADVQ